MLKEAWMAKKKKAKLGPNSQFAARPNLNLFFGPIRASLSAEKNLAVTKKGARFFFYYIKTSLCCSKKKELDSFFDYN
jgi:hypothetical protein